MSSRRNPTTIVLAIVSFLFSPGHLLAQPANTDPLASWSDGPAKKSVLDFVRVTTDRASPKFVPPEERIAAFDQDGTLWVEHPMYSQMIFTLDQVVALAPQHPEWKTTAPSRLCSLATKRQLQSSA